MGNLDHRPERPPRLIVGLVITMGSPDKLEDARNSLGSLECQITEIGRFDSPKIDKLVDEAQGFVMEAKDALKAALALLKKLNM